MKQIHLNPFCFNFLILCRNSMKTWMDSKKLLQRAKKKFENKVLEQIAQKIAIHQVELSTIFSSLESTYNNVTTLFSKLCDMSIFTKDIKEKLAKIDEDMKASAQQMQLDLSSSFAHFSKIRYLSNKQAELL